MGLQGLAGGPTAVRPRMALSLFCPGAAPGFAGHLLAGKQRAAGGSVGRLALVKRAIGAMLACRVLWVLDLVGLGGVVFVAQRHGLWVGFLHQRCGSLRLRQTRRRQNARAHNGLNDKGSAVRFHVGSLLLKRDLARYDSK